MNYLKIQQDLLKALHKQEKVSYFATDDGTFLTINGMAGYVIPNNVLLVNMAGAQVMLPMDLTCYDASLVGTDNYRMGGTAREYKRPDGQSVYVNTQLLKCFDQPFSLYQGAKITGPIIITEPLNQDQTVCGLVMPVRIKDDNN